MNDAPPLSIRPIIASITASLSAWLSSVTLDHCYKILLLAGAAIGVGYSVWKWSTEWLDRRARRRARLTGCARCPHSPDRLDEEGAR